MKPLTTIQAARILGVTPTRVQQLILSGKLPATKHGRDWIVKEQDLIEFKSHDRPAGRPRKKVI